MPVIHLTEQYDISLGTERTRGRHGSSSSSNAPDSAGRVGDLSAHSTCTKYQNWHLKMMREIHLEKYFNHYETYE